MWMNSKINRNSYWWSNILDHRTISQYIDWYIISILGTIDILCIIYWLSAILIFNLGGLYAKNVSSRVNEWNQSFFGLGMYSKTAAKSHIQELFITNIILWYTIINHLIAKIPNKQTNKKARHHESLCQQQQQQQQQKCSSSHRCVRYDGGW